MKWFYAAAALPLILITTINPVSAFDVAKKPGQVQRTWTGYEYADFTASIPPEFRPAHLDASAQVDTYTIVFYDFEEMNWQGWTSVDNTRRPQRCFFHVDDFDGLEGWSPLEGTKSMWCGTRPDAGDPYLCSWPSAPGYGNRWKQSFISDPFGLQGGHFTLSFKALFDFEPVCDWVSIDYDRGSG